MANEEREAAALEAMREWGERLGAERVAALLDLGDAASTLEWEPERHPGPTSIQLDLERGEVLAPFGVVATLSDGVRALAGALGGRSVASVDFATRDPAVPLTIAAREAEGVVLASGDLLFEAS